MILFSWKLASNYGPEHPIHILAYKPDRETINFTYAFVLDNVFVEGAEGGSYFLKNIKKW